MCLHLIFVAIEESLSLPGMQVLNNFSMRRRKKEKINKQKYIAFDEDSDFDNDIDEENMVD